MTFFCVNKRLRTGAAIVALLVTSGATYAMESAPENQPAFQAQVNRAFSIRDSTIVTLNLPDAPGRPLVVEFNIKGQDYTLDLRPHSVRSADFVCYEALPNGVLVEVDPGPERTLRGMVLEDDASIVAGSLLEYGLSTMILFSNGDQYWIEPLAGRVAGAAPGSHVIYHSNDVLEHGGICDMPDGPGNLPVDVHPDDDPLSGGGGPDCITQLACDADFPYFEDYGSISLVAAQIGNVINTMNVQYETEVDITHVISGLVVRTTADSDPYTTTDSFDLVCQLGNYWDDNMDTVGRDTVQLFTGRDIDGTGIGRAAQFGGICDGTACGFFPCDGCAGNGIAAGHYSWVQSDFNNNFACATDLSAHELGHLWDAHHCNCPGCTMNPVIQCANTFCGPGVQAAIIAFRNTVTCLDCSGSASFCGDANAGICYTANASPYCDDSACCETVCAADPFCCNSLWDQLCANEALDLCGNCGDAAAGDCLSSNGSPGCEDAECCATICTFDDFCCDSFWDAICAEEAFDFCHVPPSNDLCEDAIALTVPGSAVGWTNDATIDDAFPFCGTSITAPGVWYSVIGTGNTITVTTCSEFTEYDTKITVYCNGCADPICVGGNDDNCDAFVLHSTVEWCSQADTEYLILVHGFSNNTGGFVLSVFDDGIACGVPDGCVDSPCGAGAGNCYVANGTPGCDNVACCEVVCAIDAFCCETNWDSVCAGEAAEICGNCGGADAGSCNKPNGTPGCDDFECCQAVCATDPFCCNQQWDTACVNGANKLCGTGGLIWFNNQAEFEAFASSQGKVQKGIEDFEESILPPNTVDGFDDPLESGVPNSPDGFPFPDGMTGLSNLIVQSNTLGNDPVDESPAGANGLAAASVDFLGAVSDIVISNTFVNGLDLIFTSEKTAVGFNTIDALGEQIGVTVRVYSTSNVFLGLIESPAEVTGINFLGVWSPDPIGRINIFSIGNGAEGADRIQAWQEGNPCPWDLDGNGVVGTSDMLALFAQWGSAGSADFDGSGTVGTSDMLILFAHWGPCP